MGRVIGIDFGRSRVGIAVSDPARMIAQPLVTIDTGGCLDWLAQYFAAYDVDLVVIGMPLQPNGEPSDSQRYIIPFIFRFKRRFEQMEIREVDERYTTVMAMQAMIEGGVKKSKRRDAAGVIDRTAAALILQGFLDTL